MNTVILAVSQTPAAHGAQFGGGALLAVAIVLICSAIKKKK